MYVLLPVTGPNQLSNCFEVRQQRDVGTIPMMLIQHANAMWIMKPSVLVVISSHIAHS